MPFERRRVLWLAPIVWVPDLDYIIPNEHRAVTHSLLIPAVLLAVVVGRWRGSGAKFWEFATRPTWVGDLTLASYYFASHLFLDVFAGGVVLLWPFVDYALFAGFQIVLDTATNTFTGAGEAGVEAGAPTLAPRYPWLTFEHTALVAFTAVVTLAWWVQRARVRWWPRAARLTSKLPPKDR